MSNKFSIGDKVVINTKSKRLPLWIRQEVKRTYRIRTIGAVFYYPKQQHTAYYLGTNQKDPDISRYPFRAETLRLYKMKHATKLHKMRNLQNRKNGIRQEERGLQYLLSETSGLLK